MNLIFSTYILYLNNATAFFHFFDCRVYSTKILAYPMQDIKGPEPNRQRFMDLFVSMHLFVLQINQCSFSKYLSFLNPVLDHNAGIKSQFFLLL